jgi:hypothetical protein
VEKMQGANKPILEELQKVLLQHNDDVENSIEIYQELMEFGSSIIP